MLDDEEGSDGTIGHQAGAMVLGRKTYEGLAAVWLQLADDPTLGVFADRTNSMHKYVASRPYASRWSGTPTCWNATWPTA